MQEKRKVSLSLARINRGSSSSASRSANHADLLSPTESYAESLAMPGCLDLVCVSWRFLTALSIRGVDLNGAKKEGLYIARRKDT